MAQEAMATELLAMRKRAERTAQNIDQISLKLSAKQQTLRQVVSEYGAKRVELLQQELHARGMTWCTYCSEIVPTGRAELLLVEGREEYSHGYGNAYYSFSDFLKLHRACPVCRERAADKHGQKGAYKAQAKDQASFYAFRVEKRDDGYYARKFGNWVQLSDESCKLAKPSDQLVEKLAEEWSLPPRIALDHRDNKLVVYE